MKPRRRWGCLLAAAMLLCAAGSQSARAAPAFVVSVCLADVEYSIACREHSLLEAARRLEQIFVDDYKTRRATGSLRVWFPLNTPQSEQLRFLREAESRAIEAAIRKMQTAVDNPETVQSPGEKPVDRTAAEQAGLLAQLLQRRREDIQKWRETAMLDARKGSSWSHDWATRTHVYKPGPALDELVRSPNGNSDGNL